MSKIASDAARQVLDVVPLVMRTIRAEFRGQRSADLSLPEFRTLAFIKNNDGASLSSLAWHTGLTLPSTSKLIDGLVGRGLVARDSHHGDRRKICLRLTSAGQSELEAAFDHTQTFLTEKMAGLAKEDLNTIIRSMQILKVLFASEHPEKPALKTRD